MVPSTFFTSFLLFLSGSWSKVFANFLANDGFIAEIVGSTKAISGTFIPNPRNDFKPMLILNAKSGQIHVLENPDESEEDLKILDIESDLCTNGERGLHSVIPSPNFRENFHLFAFYTKHKEGCLEDPVEGPYNVVMRFAMDPETLQLDSSEGTLIFRSPPMDERMHNGGAMAFGNDGKLYVTTGDAGIRDNARVFDNNHASIIRLNEDGTVPDNNPFTRASGYPNSYRCADTEGRVPDDAPEDSRCAEVWANGLRNPFRMDMDYSVTDKVHFTLGEVGAQHIEAIHFGGTDYKATDYGWPKYEGVCRPGHIDECEPNTDPGITMPFHWYEHISYEDGGCVGGQVHVPQGIWPPEFKYLFIDFILLEIYNLELDHPELACEECSPPLPPTKNETFYTSVQEEDSHVNQARMVDMWFGPYRDTQALYVTRYGNRDTIIRIRYSGIIKKPPTPKFEFEIDGDLAVTFDASLTTNPEDDDLKYEWDFGDESELLVNAIIVSHQYALPGEYIATLKVTDTSGQEQKVSDIVRVGSPPKVTIVSPSEGSTFSVGTILRLKGEAVDSAGNPIPDERLSWEVRQHHAGHFHPFLDPSTNMNDFDLWPAPDPEDYLAATNSFLTVLLTAKDEYGVSETVFMDVMPNIVMVNVTTRPPGLEVVVDGSGIEAPEIITSWEGFMLPVIVKDQGPYIFKEWSDGQVARNRKFAIFNRANGEIPQVRALFCSALATFCENHDECCSGYCSSDKSGICAITPSPPSLSPTSQETDKEKEQNKCGLIVHYKKAGIRKKKFCLSRKFLKKALNLCHRPLWGEEGIVADVCCHSCAMFQNK